MLTFCSFPSDWFHLFQVECVPRDLLFQMCDEHYHATRWWKSDRIASIDGWDWTQSRAFKGIKIIYLVYWVNIYFFFYFLQTYEWNSIILFKGHDRDSDENPIKRPRLMTSEKVRRNYGNNDIVIVIWILLSCERDVSYYLLQSISC